MQEFKQIVKMKCGGSVNKAVEKCGGGRMKDGGKVMHDDVKEDKKLIKKAINLHDDQLHEGKKTDLKTLKKGGRCKRDGGTVRKYKAGGEVKKMAMGGLTDPTTQALVNADVLRRRRAAQGAGGLGAPGVNPAVQGAGVTPATPAGAPVMPNPSVQAPGAVMKKGGKVKGCK